MAGCRHLGFGPLPSIPGIACLPCTRNRLNDPCCCGDGPDPIVPGVYNREIPAASIKIPLGLSSDAASAGPPPLHSHRCLYRIATLRPRIPLSC